MTDNAYPVQQVYELKMSDGPTWRMDVDHVVTLPDGRVMLTGTARRPGLVASYPPAPVKFSLRVLPNHAGELFWGTPEHPRSTGHEAATPSGTGQDAAASGTTPRRTIHDVDRMPKGKNPYANLSAQEDYAYAGKMAERAKEVRALQSQQTLTPEEWVRLNIMVADLNHWYTRYRPNDPPPLSMPSPPRQAPGTPSLKVV